jgi:hypothetical protein
LPLTAGERGTIYSKSNSINSISWRYYQQKNERGTDYIKSGAGHSNSWRCHCQVGKEEKYTARVVPLSIVTRDFYLQQHHRVITNRRKGCHLKQESCLE